MPELTMLKRVISVSDANNIVISAYNKALEQSGFDFSNPDNVNIKNKLAIGSQVPNPGFTASLIRKTHLGYAASYTLPDVHVTMKEWSFALQDVLENKLIEELAISRLRHKGRENFSAEEKHYYILETTNQIASVQIDNHYILIYELLKRIAGVALSDDFMKNKVLDEIHEDKYVLLLRNFINQLMINRENAAILFSGKDNIFAWFNKSPISSYANFLKEEVVARWGQAINSMIFNHMAYERPKNTFDVASTLIKGMQVTMRGHLLVYLHELSKLVLKQSLLDNAKNIDAQVVDKIFVSAIDLLISRLTTSTSNQIVLISRDDKKIDATEQGFRIVMEVFNNELAKKSSELQLQYGPLITQLRTYFELDMQLLLIDESLGQFSYVSELGGWIPIMLDLISPDKLAVIMEKFIKNAMEHSKAPPLETSPDFQLGLLGLPSKEWVALQRAVVAIRNLSNQFMIDEIRDRFNAHFARLNIVQTKLIEYNLLSPDDRLISPIAQPLLTVEYKVSAGTDASIILTPNGTRRQLDHDSPPRETASQTMILRPRQALGPRKNSLSQSSSSRSSSHGFSSHSQSSYPYQTSPHSPEANNSNSRIQRSLTFLTGIEQQNRQSAASTTADTSSQTSAPSRSSRYDN